MTGSLRPPLVRSIVWLCAGLLLLLALPMPMAHSATTLPASSSDAIAADVFHRLNDERAARGLPALRWDGQLAALATGWSGEMSRTGSYVHNDLNGVLHDPAFGDRWSGLGENIHQILPGQSTAGRAHVDWMRSDGHRMNILNPGYDAVGVGVVCDGDGRMWATQSFGRAHGSQRPGHDRTPPPAGPIAHADTGGSSCAAHLHARHGADWPTGAQVTASDVDTDTITVQWSAATRNVRGYRIEMDAGRGFETIGTVDRDARTRTQSGLSPDTDHRFRVWVRDARDHYHPGPEVTVRTAQVPPATAGLPTWSALLEAAIASASGMLTYALSVVPPSGEGMLRDATRANAPSRPLADAPRLLTATHPVRPADAPVTTPPAAEPALPAPAASPAPAPPAASGTSPVPAAPVVPVAPSSPAPTTDPALPAVPLPALTTGLELELQVEASVGPLTVDLGLGSR